MPLWRPSFTDSTEFMAFAIIGLLPLALVLYVYLAVAFHRSGWRYWCTGLFLAGPAIAVGVDLLSWGDIGGYLLAAMAALAIASPLELAWRAGRQVKPMRKLELAGLPLAILACWYFFAIAAENSTAV